jgi:hypothetical protein
LLELWIRDYPHDFAVRGTAGALSALIKSIIAKSYLLHYGSDFLPFLEVLPNLVDKDAPWALEPEDITDESDDSYSFCEEDDIMPVVESAQSGSSTFSTTVKGADGSSTRERKPSLPLSAKALVMPHMATAANLHQPDGADLSTKQLCRELFKLSQEINALDCEEIAQEITRMESKLFLDIEVSTKW